VIRVGYGLLAMGLVGGWSARHFIPEREWGITIAGLFLLTGTLMLLISAAMRIFRGQIILRPMEALKHAAWFVPIMQLCLFVTAVFIGGMKEVVEGWFNILLTPVIAAIFVCLWSTAYRKPE
jgi:hypothetical protein